MTASGQQNECFHSATAARKVTAHPEGFEEQDDLRSHFIRELIDCQIGYGHTCSSDRKQSTPIPLHLIQYWHDQTSVPADVSECLNSWRRLAADGFRFSMFNDASAAAYIKHNYGASESEAFTRCHHPAMRCDYLRICVLVAEGGLYVDADDVLLGEGWRALYRNQALKVQPLCYDTRSSSMVPADEIRRVDCSTRERVFYVNNDPIASPPEHPLLRRALKRATQRLLKSQAPQEIQSTTGPGNLTAALAAHARHMFLQRHEPDFELLLDWDSIAETRWELSYRTDERNWRNVNPF